MPADKLRNGRLGGVVSGAVGLLLVGMTAAPAHAETIRDQQWYLSAMKADQMWRTSTGKGVTVAVIDSGVDGNLPDLKGQVLPGLDEAPESPGDEHTSYDGHGTTMGLLIAGTGKANGGNGTFGLAPGARILPVRVPDRGWDSNKYTDEFNKVLSRGVRYAVDSGARVINISMGAYVGSDELTAAVKYALNKGALVFASVGNSGTSEVEYPAGTPGVVAVGAVGRDLHKTAESQHGPQVDLAAPGDEMYHACPNGKDLCRSHGTSDATALASASAALIWSKHPTWTNNQVLRVLLNTAGGPTDGAKRNDSIGYGIVRPRIALQDPGDPGPADVYPLPDLSAAAPASPSPGTAASKDPASQAKDGEAVAEASSDKGGSGTLWAALGIGAVVLVGTVVAAVVTRKRRRSVA
ncbi:type VII secretion-associated serine protease mycosin [Streptomyces sp. NK08204]|uniref:type VII secretion-associated serine protease mycosin n=1 Tax=Streptomyces sp. NK08204 TaxID=2873260 RepID=UPI001CEC55CF|nr:type VII secretion-associated serine protease mycosin [Streptomyces sp. NK08204]